MTGCDSGCDSGGLEVTHFRLDVTITSITSITSGFCTDVTLDVHFQGAALVVASGPAGSTSVRLEGGGEGREGGEGGRAVGGWSVF